MTHHSKPAEAVACLYTVQGDSQPFMRISRGMLHAAGDIVAVQPLGPLPATPAPAAEGLEAVRVAKTALDLVRGIIGEASMTGFNCHDGDWAERLYASQADTHAAVKACAAALASTAATSAPAYVVNCCNCGRIIDTREESEGGDQWGHELSDDRWACSPECLDAVTEPVDAPAETQGRDGVREAWEAWDAPEGSDFMTRGSIAKSAFFAGYRAALAPSTSAATRGEPVAWRYRRVIDGKPMPWRYSDMVEAHPDLPGGPDERQPLYATPPAPGAQVKVKPLEWHRSHMTPWNGDYHTVPTAYSVRCADENGWKWQGLGAHGYAPSPEGAQAGAQSHHNAYVRASLATDREG
ncbi:hypothetical protein [Bosea sp. NPDC055594]